MKFCFVILHYKTADDTIDCIKSIRRMDNVYPIVVVDNASNNGSIEAVESKFANDKDIHIIKNEANLGFAAGNNIGYQYARKELHSDFIAVSNNDIVIESQNMPEYVESYYKNKRFHLMGPDIESLVDHGHQNPVTPDTDDLTKVKFEIRRYKMLLILSHIGLYDLLKSHKPINQTRKSNDAWKNENTNMQLHGSFVIFSPDFVKDEEYAFRPGTFLYMEEGILYHYCNRKGYIMCYSPAIKVYHKEDSSTNYLFKADKGKREFVFRNMIKSLNVYLKIISNM